MTRPGTQSRLLRLRLRSASILTVASAAGLVMLVWPLLVHGAGSARMQPPFLFVALLPLVLVVVLAELSEGGIDSRVLALLGVLVAVVCVLRGISAGTAGVELVFFMLILAGRVFGPGFGFVLGCTALFASALVTAGVGPWLPYQMLVAGWVGMGAGLLPVRRRSMAGEVAMLVGYGVLAAYSYGVLMNLSSWPFLLGIDVPGASSQLAFVPGDPVLANLKRFGVYTLVTSTGSWDTGRAITTAIALIVLGPAVLTTLRRVSRRVHITATAEPALTETRPQVVG
ncbi:MAG: ECF transporter S component [Nocardioides sp.]